MTHVLANPQARTLLPTTSLLWLAFGLAALVCTAATVRFPWLQTYPEGWVIPLSDVINLISHWFVDHFKWIFRAISAIIEVPMKVVQSILHWLPWPATITLFLLFALRFGSRGLAIFTGLALGYMVIVGYWDQSMNTLALVAISVPLSVVLGMALGILAYRFPRFDIAIQAVLDISICLSYSNFVSFRLWPGGGCRCQHDLCGSPNGAQHGAWLAPGPHCRH
jgi:hypothetical protein